MSKLQWDPWHEVVKLRPDVKSGELTLNVFVLRDRAGKVIQIGGMGWAQHLTPLTGSVVVRDLNFLTPWSKVKIVGLSSSPRLLRRAS